MNERKQIPLRLDPAIHEALARWAADDLRSLNAQIELVLRDGLARAGRLPSSARPLRPRGRPPKERRPGEPAGTPAETSGEAPAAASVEARDDHPGG